MCARRLAIKLAQILALERLREQIDGAAFALLVVGLEDPLAFRFDLTEIGGDFCDRLLGRDHGRVRRFGAGFQRFDSVGDQGLPLERGNVRLCRVDVVLLVRCVLAQANRNLLSIA